MIWTILILVVVAAICGGLVFPFITMALHGRVGRLERRVARMENASRAPSSRPTGSTPDDEKRSSAALPPKTVEQQAREPPASRTARDFADEKARTGPQQSPGADDSELPVAASMTSDRAPAGPSASANFEHALTSRWLVWIGGGTIALGGIFLVKYGVEQGLLSPTVRLISSAAFGIVLVVAGEWLRRRSPDVTYFPSVDYVPAAASAAGLAVLFGSVYGGYALYDLLAPLVAFALLAGVSLAAIGLSLLQGPYIAALGLVGAYAVPLLIRSDADSPWPLFAFVLTVTAGGLGVVRYKEWSWLAWLSLAGAAMWAAIWMVISWHPGDAASVSVFLFAILAMFVATRGEALFDRAAAMPPLLDVDRLPFERKLVLAASGAVLFLIWFVVGKDVHGPVGLVAAGSLFTAMLYLACRCRGTELVAAGAAFMALFILATWESAGFADLLGRVPVGADDGAGVSNAELYSYSLAWLVLASALLGIGLLRGLIALRWASLVLLVATIFKVFLWDMANLAGLYRVGSFVGLGLSLLAVGYVYRRFVYRQGPEIDQSITVPRGPPSGDIHNA